MCIRDSLNVGEHLLGKIFGGVEVAVLEQPAAHDREDDLDLVEPARMVGGELKAPARMGPEPRLDVGTLVSGEVVHDRDDLLTLSRRDRLIDLLQEADQVK